MDTKKSLVTPVYKMVEVYKTDVQELVEADKVIRKLLELNPDYKINFDLEDCDRILRIEGFEMDLNHIENKLKELNYTFELLT